MPGHQRQKKRRFREIQPTTVRNPLEPATCHQTWLGTAKGVVPLARRCPSRLTLGPGQIGQSVGPTAWRGFKLVSFAVSVPLSAVVLCAVEFRFLLT
eukprot:2012737-Rhodomonas_salina.1